MLKKLTVCLFAFAMFSATIFASDSKDTEKSTTSEMKMIFIFL